MSVLHYEHKDEPIYGTHYSRWWVGDHTQVNHVSISHTITDHTMPFMSFHKQKHHWYLHFGHIGFSAMANYGPRMPFKFD